MAVSAVTFDEQRERLEMTPVGGQVDRSIPVLAASLEVGTMGDERRNETRMPAACSAVHGRAAVAVASFQVAPRSGQNIENFCPAVHSCNMNERDTIVISLMRTGTVLK
jgi:hypothetical protein